MQVFQQMCILVSRIKPCISINIVAEGAHASSLVKSCPQATRSFCPVHTLFFFFLFFFLTLAFSFCDFSQHKKCRIILSLHAPKPGHLYVNITMLFQCKKPFVRGGQQPVHRSCAQNGRSQLKWLQFVTKRRS